ncbi:hypothetical protein NDU88_005638 [Pleurodeles waltl]|uniref:Uncharacterized protein n=1 Tax=Pleurodeles waltl TaxID=8319 RepID=A0AAV7N1U7_PLEWA|nr:hypothetical protein NDU88_005638 [Pleurodeles waltl]
MAYYANEEEQYGELQEETSEHLLEERLVEALGYHVQDSVNWALIQALKPFTQPLSNFARREFLGESSQQPRLQTGDSGDVLGLRLQRSGGTSSAEILSQMATSVLRDHAYGGSPPPQISPSIPVQTSSQSSYHDPSSSKSDSDESQTDTQPRKKQRKAKHNTPKDDTPQGKNLLFSPEDIIHPRSTEWVPQQEVANYVQDRLRRSFEKEVCNTLRSECPRPSLLGKVADTPELDPNMATFLRKFAKDPKKGLDRAWKDPSIIQKSVRVVKEDMIKLANLPKVEEKHPEPLLPEAN